MRFIHLPLLALAALTSPQGPIEFHPREGSELAKKFETSLSLSVDDFGVEMNGQEVDPSTFMGDIDLDSANLEVTLAVAVRDTYVALGGGRPLELLREFKSIEATFENGMGDSDTSDGEGSGLLGRSVRFEWKPEDETYARSFEGEGGDEEDLLVLSEDMDLRDLIPPKDVEEGAEWRINWSEHLDLIMPGLDLEAARQKLTAEMSADTEEAAEVPRAIVESFLDALLATFADATATCTNNGVREVDGHPLSVVGIQSTIDGTLDLASFADSLGDEFPAGISIDQLDIDLSIKVSGELLWDSTAGHFHSLELSGEIGGELSLDVSVDMNGTQFQGSATAEYSGTLGRTASLE